MLVDTGPLVAVANANDDAHLRCLDFLEQTSSRLLVPTTVLTEVCYLLETRRGPAIESAFLSDFGRGALELVNLVPDDLTRMAELITRYADLPLCGTDASVIAIAERLGLSDMVTLDRRHFSIVRPQHVESFTIYP